MTEVSQTINGVAGDLSNITSELAYFRDYVQSLMEHYPELPLIELFALLDSATTKAALAGQEAGEIASAEDAEDLVEVVNRIVAGASGVSLGDFDHNVEINLKVTPLTP